MRGGQRPFARPSMKPDPRGTCMKPAISTAETARLIEGINTMTLDEDRGKTRMTLRRRPPTQRPSLPTQARRHAAGWSDLQRLAGQVSCGKEQLMPRVEWENCSTGAGRRNNEITGFKGVDHVHFAPIIAAIVVVTMVAILLLASKQAGDVSAGGFDRNQGAGDKIFPLGQRLRRSIVWSPWEKRDTELKHNYGGARAAKAQPMAARKKSGTGHMGVIKSTAQSKS